MEPIHLLLIEDDKVDQLAFQRSVKEQRLAYQYVIAGSVAEARRILDEQHFDMIVADYRLGDGTVFDVFPSATGTPIIVVTGAGDETVAVRAMKAGAADYLIKDAERAYLEVLPICVDKVLKQRRAEAERQHAEEALRRSEAHNRALLSAIPDSMLRLTRDGLILDVRPGIGGGLDASRGVLAGANIAQAWPADVAPWIMAIVERTLQTGETQTWEYRQSEPGQPPGDHEVRVVASGENEVLAIVRDISERKRLERELIAAREAALDTARAKSAFFATMSHQIRNPIGAVSGFADLLLDTELTDEQREFSELIRSSADILLRLINDILDFSKIDTGKLQLDIADFDLQEVVDEVMDVFAERADHKGLELACLVAPDVPTAVRGDSFRLRQVLLNLLGNAVKFTEQGEVVLEVRNAESGMRSAAAIELRFTVRDTGIGIPAEAQQYLFQPFSQLSNSVARKYGGSGLGLAIAKQLVNLMGGEIAVQSAPGRGTTFWFTVRFAAPAGAAAVDQPAIDLQGKRFLIVDDHAATRLMLHQRLEAWHADVGEAAGGGEALALLRSASGQRQAYDAVILDLRMPQMDGLALTRAVRANPALATVRLILMTSFHHRVSSGVASECGIAGRVTKPVGAARLRACLRKVLAAAPAECQRDAAGRAA